MVRVSKKYLKKELKNEAWNRFSSVIGRSGSEEVLMTNLKRFLTISEIAMLEKRLAILTLLDRKMSYLDIRHLIDVSPGTVSFTKHNFTKGKRIYKKHISYLPRKVKEKPFFIPSRAEHGRRLHRL